MLEFSLSSPAEPSRAPITHPVHRATALLQEALHESRRATFTQEFGEIRGIHRLSAPPAAEVFVDADRTSGFAARPFDLACVEAYVGHAPDEVQEAIARQPGSAALEGDKPALAVNRAAASEPTEAADQQLRGLIRDFKERQRKAGLIVAGSVISAATLTVMTIALVIALVA
ncbi:MAG: hypothetical protein P8Y82_00190 [Methyloceanibacter sp.]